MSDWVDEEQVNRAKLLWIVDDQTEVSDLKNAAQHNLPLVVPDNNPTLKAFCRSNNCGLYYSNVFEAVECLKYLVENEQARYVIGQNSDKSL